MKRFLKFLLPALLVCGATFVSCTKDTPVIPVPPYTDQEGKYLRTIETDDGWATILYTGMGADGTLKELSEVVCYPDLSGENTAEHLAIGCHITITSNAECPSNYKNISAMSDVKASATMLTSTRKLVVFPDYEGYGATASTPHPYLQREVTARQVIAGAQAALQWFKQEKGKELSEGWKSVVFGYSQGGAVAASVVRFYQENKLEGLNLIAGACGDGPYDPLATLKQYISDNKVYMPLSPALVVKGIVDCDTEMKKLGCKYSDFMTEGFIASGIFESLGNKTKTTDEIHSQLLSYSKEHDDFTMMVYNCETKTFLPYNKENTTLYPKDSQWNLASAEAKSYCTADQCFTAAAIDFFSGGKSMPEPNPKMVALKNALEKNSLTYGGWKPEVTTQPSFLFFHSTNDEVVPFCNYENVRDAWGLERMKGYKGVSESGTHYNGGIYFVLMNPSAYITPLLNGVVKPGEETTEF